MKQLEAKIATILMIGVVVVGMLAIGINAWLVSFGG